MYVILQKSNRILLFCILWDMDKMIYTCYAEHIGYSFPKRKWWESRKKEREVITETEAVFSDRRVGIIIRILEGEGQDFTIAIPDRFREDICQEFIRQSCKGKHFEILLLVDPEGKIAEELVYRAAEDMNYLAVYTKNPQAYEGILERLEQENGLGGMLFTDYREWKQYRRVICEKRKSLVFLMNAKNGWGEKAEPIFFRAYGESLVLDLGEEIQTGRAQKTGRMGKDYVSLRCYLDNIIKNGYNSLVNEGLQQKLQMKTNRNREHEKNKLSEKRKGTVKWKKRKIF